MPILTDPAIALARLTEMVQPQLDPVLTQDMGQLLNDFKRASVWTASTVYSVGDVVIPVTRNGHRFVCVTSGTSAATEPSWSDGVQSSASDGSTLMWREDGPEIDLWDLRGAASKAFALKMAIAQGKASVAVGPVRKEQQQIFQQCKEMALFYAPISIG